MHNNQAFKTAGSSPPVPELIELHRRWQLLYEAVHQSLGSSQRIKVNAQDVTHIPVNDFDSLCQQLQVNVNTWLKSESFQNIERQLRTLLSRDDEIRVIIETHVTLHRIHWHLWDFFEDYDSLDYYIRFTRNRYLLSFGINSNVTFKYIKSLTQILKWVKLLNKVM